jgi:hypothetical protein
LVAAVEGPDRLFFRQGRLYFSGISSISDALVCRAQSGDADLKRDFRAEAEVLLGAVHACGARPQSTTKLLNLLGTGDIGSISVTLQERQRLIGASTQIDRQGTLAAAVSSSSRC